MMLRRFRSLPSPALVISCIALVLAVGGGTFALAVSDNHKDKKIAKKVANRQITRRARGLSVSHASTADSASHASTAESANGLAPPEPFHLVGEAGEPQFQHSCRSAAGLSPPPEFFKDHEGVVHLQGTYGNCSTTGLVAFQLPPGYRPENGHTLAFVTPNNATTFTNVSVLGPGVVPNSDGGVACDEPFCTLDGITFRAQS